MNKKILIVILLVFLIALLVGINFISGNRPVMASQKETDLVSLSCEELINKTELIKLNYECETDTDCALVDTGWCGSCVNKDRDKEAAAELRDIYNAGCKKGCFPEFECMPKACKCVENKCVSEAVKE